MSDKSSLPKSQSSIVELDGMNLCGYDQFHDTFKSALGFPDYYGRNMNAWIDCMTHLDDAEAGMTSVPVKKGGVLTLSISNIGYLRENGQEQHDALLECSAFVNQRRIELGEPPVLALSFND